MKTTAFARIVVTVSYQGGGFTLFGIRNQELGIKLNSGFLILNSNLKGGE